MSRVRDAFALSLAHSTATIARAAGALLRGEREARVRLTDPLHRLAGTAGSLGFEPLGAAARALESSLIHADERWYAQLSPLLRAMDEATASVGSVARALERGGTARSGFVLTDEPLDLASAPGRCLTRSPSLAACPSTPRGALLVDARKDLIDRVRTARAAWDDLPVVAVIPNASEAQILLGLRSGADLVHRGPFVAEALDASRWAALPPPVQGASVLWIDADPLRASAVRAALEPLGARVNAVDDREQLPRAVRPPLPHLVVVDPTHPDAVAMVDWLEERLPTVATRTLGIVPWFRAALHQVAFVPLVAEVGKTLAQELGPDDVPLTEPKDYVQTVKLSRAELSGLVRAKKGSPS